MLFAGSRHSRPNPTFQPRLGWPTAVGLGPAGRVRELQWLQQFPPPTTHFTLSVCHQQASHLPAIDCFLFSFLASSSIYLVFFTVTRLASCRFLYCYIEADLLSCLCPPLCSTSISRLSFVIRTTLEKENIPESPSRQHSRYSIRYPAKPFVNNLTL